MTRREWLPGAVGAWLTAAVATSQLLRMGASVQRPAPAVFFAVAVSFACYLTYRLARAGAPHGEDGRGQAGQAEQAGQQGDAEGRLERLNRAWAANTRLRLAVVAVFLLVAVVMYVRAGT